MLNKLMILLLVGWIGTGLASIGWSADKGSAPVCDSCSIQVNSLDEPLRLSGYWQFTRDDQLSNKDPGIDTSSWTLVKAPGAWNKAYADGKNFQVGWYRGVFHFAPELVGKKVVLLVDSFLASMQVYVDGSLVYERAGLQTGQKYYGVQAVPIIFTVTQTQHTFAMRVDTLNMVGVYQLPFELRSYERVDRALGLWHFFSSDMRAFSAFFALFAGAIFLLYFVKTQYTLYLLTTLACLGFFPFFLHTSDFMQNLVEPQRNFCLHFIGIVLGPFSLNLLAQHQFRASHKWNIFMACLGLGLSLWFVILSVRFNLDQMMVARKIAIFSALLAVIHAKVNYIRCFLRPGPRTSSLYLPWAAATFFLTVGIHDVLIALGKINSVQLIFSGCLVSIIAQVLVSSNALADTLVQNRRLVARLKVVNEELELKVQDRTRDIREILDHVRHGFLVVSEDRRVGGSFSASCVGIFRTAELAGRDVAELFRFDQEKRAMFILACEQIFENIMPLEVTTSLIPQRFTIEDRIYDISVKAIENDKKEIKRLLFSISDITELEHLLKENKRHRSLLKIIAHCEAFERFMEETSQCLERARKAVAQSDLHQTRMQLHTIKGNALMFGLDEFAHVIHELETQNRVQIQELNQLTTMLQEFVDKNDDVLNLKNLDHKRVTVTQDAIDRHWKDLQAARDLGTARDIFRRLMQESKQRSAQELLGIVPEQIQALAHKMGKNVSVSVVGGNVMLDPDRVSPLIAQLTHALRNSVDHGIEAPEDREDKPSQARIEIGFYETSASLSIRIADDGRGLDPDIISRRAVEKGLVTAEACQNLSKEEIYEFIFASGFSTKDQATEISGRGLGMEALRQAVRALGGDLKLESEVGRGTTLILHWPRSGYQQVA
ncbi:MAG TPA: ATP-binding protein [Oligoflexus sp.]|uniref:ATP-binding protein n=1 Tax=Oligoflexus sp. TaxID=1971216 RepID=UPI002D5FDBE8|nr:ATP-binding protein [Oligoflexus sp.]HYX37489.1 ATP-binding protein [Oligoflexus sp.]